MNYHSLFPRRGKRNRIRGVQRFSVDDLRFFAGDFWYRYFALNRSEKAYRNSGGKRLRHSRAWYVVLKGKSRWDSPRFKDWWRGERSLSLDLLLVTQSRRCFDKKKIWFGREQKFVDCLVGFDKDETLAGRAKGFNWYWQDQNEEVDMSEQTLRKTSAGWPTARTLIVFDAGEKKESDEKSEEKKNMTDCEKRRMLVTFTRTFCREFRTGAQFSYSSDPARTSPTVRANVEKDDGHFFSAEDRRQLLLERRRANRRMWFVRRSRARILSTVHDVQLLRQTLTWPRNR